jgi:hypothetical protein
MAAHLLEVRSRTHMLSSVAMSRVAPTKYFTQSGFQPA